jgi:NAD(P)H-hydrate repair Nnr-like enzyme with NAD(P)H-hydrate epimerase domain
MQGRIGIPMQIPFITTQQMVEVDRLMIEEYDIQLIQMMENVGRNLAELSRRMLGGDVRSKRIAVLCGAGNNGVGGLVAARHLHNWRADIVLKIPDGCGVDDRLRVDVVLCRLTTVPNHFSEC